MYFVEDIDAVFRLFEAREEGRNRFESWVATQDILPAYCAVCAKITSIHIGGPSETWINLRGQSTCQECGLSGRMRSLFHAVGLTLQGREMLPGLMFERVTTLFRVLAERLPHLVGCEYLGREFSPGTMAMTDATRRRLGNVPVQHEDMQALSLPDNSLGFVIHSDVLEHIPEPDRALAECHRVLSPGGVLIFTCPIYANADTQRIAELVNGETRFFGQPAFHGDPLSEAGVPVYNNFGFDLFDRVGRSGFARVEIGFASDSAAGYFSDANPWRHALMWHILCRATKSLS